MFIDHTVWRFLALCFACSVLTASHGAPASATPDQAKNKTQPNTIRWSETRPGCTFSRDDDGKYRYGVWSGDYAVILAIDARELQIIRHRIEPILGVLLTIRYRGPGTLQTNTEGITLQFMKHFKVVQPALDPDDYAEKVQADADAADAETRRWVTHHPQKKENAEAREQDYQKSVSELIDFLGRDAMHPAHLNGGTPEVSGWVFFDTKNKWLGDWKKQEEFILRVPVASYVFEFPFKLPPEPGELLLQKRP